MNYALNETPLEAAAPGHSAVSLLAARHLNAPLLMRWLRKATLKSDWRPALTWGYWLHADDGGAGTAFTSNGYLLHAVHGQAADKLPLDARRGAGRPGLHLQRFPDSRGWKAARAWGTRAVEAYQVISAPFAEAPALRVEGSTLHRALLAYLRRTPPGEDSAIVRVTLRADGHRLLLVGDAAAPLVDLPISLLARGGAVWEADFDARRRGVGGGFRRAAAAGHDVDRGGVSARDAGAGRGRAGHAALPANVSARPRAASVPMQRRLAGAVSPVRLTRLAGLRRLGNSRAIAVRLGFG